MSDGFKLRLIIAHAVLGVAAAFAGPLMTLYSLGIVAYGAYWVFSNKNKNGEAHLLAAYLVGLEIFLRMTDTNLIWEFGKYSTLAVLLPGCLFKPSKTGGKFWILFLLMLPSIIVAEYPSFDEMRTSLSFNLSGPLLLATAAYYFYDRPLSKGDVQKLLFCFILPMIAMGVYLSWQSPSLSQIEFGLSSDGGFSGGFGSNQVSTILGAGMAALGVAYLLGFSLTPYKWLDYGLFFLLTFRGLLTFSRGGMVAAAGSILLGLIGLSMTRSGKGNNNLLLTLLIFIALGGIAWNILNEASGGKLMLRYEGESYSSIHYGQEQKMFTGRIAIYKKELKAFTQNLIFGIGPGMGQHYILENGQRVGLAHAEFTRLIGQHGLFGIAALLIMVTVPLNRFFKLGGATKAWLAAFIGLAFLTMAHSAMRIAMPGFFYGMALLRIEEGNEHALSGIKDH